MNSSPPLLSALQLVRQEGSATLLQDVSLHLQAGCLLGLIGPNGAGKSTLLKMLAGIEKPQSGKVLFNDRDIQEQSVSTRAAGIAWLEQRQELHWPLTVRQVVALGRLPHRGLSNLLKDKAAIDQALEFTGITALQHRIYPELSEGEKLLSNLARVLATQSQVILLDEPTAALDLEHQLLVMELLQSLAAKGIAIVAVLHELSLAAKYCQQLVLLDKGRVVAEGDAASVLSDENLASVYRIQGHLDTSTNTLTSINRLAV